MRLLVVNESGYRAGGIEVHLEHLVPALQARGHQVATLRPAPPPGATSVLPPGERTWSPVTQSPEALLNEIHAWRPEAVYVHQLIDPPLLAALQEDWPTLYFAHCYLGVCVSTTKCWKFPQPRTCTRQLGWACLLHYFPHRCGGLNPVTMWQMFQHQRANQDLLRRFDVIATHSSYVRDEYRRHDFPDATLAKIPFWIPGTREASFAPRGIDSGRPARLLFLGRCETIKGLGTLLDALPIVAGRNGRSIELIVAGDGPARPAWERQAARIMQRTPGIRVDFRGWLPRDRCIELIRESHLLVIPSLWPEPFGMTGIEAGFHALPAVAFDVGGIREWLEDGVNGVLAPGDPPTPAGLAQAIERVIGDPNYHATLCRGAWEASTRFGPEPHLQAVESLLERVVSKRRAAGLNSARPAST